jgi:branched-chain amino acid transport system substrate-binding protein
VLDDATDPTAATKNIKKLISENKVDVVVGPRPRRSSLAMMDVAVENETPLISMAGSAIVVEPMDDKRKWVFKTAQNDAHMATALVQHMTDKNVQTVAFVGFADAYGEGWYKEFAKIAEARKLKIVANERYQRNDTSVTGQILKIIAAKPDAVLVGAAGTPAALPQKALKEKGYKGLIYQTHGVSQQRFPARWRQGCRGRLPAGRADGRRRATAERQPGQEVGTRLREQLRSRARQG